MLSPDDTKGVNIQKDPTLVTLLCRRSPVWAMKIVRLRLGQAEALLKDQNFNVKVIYLVRDPRATINARLKTRFCNNIPDCKTTSILSSDLVDDSVAAKNNHQLIFYKVSSRSLMQALHADNSQYVLSCVQTPHADQSVTSILRTCGKSTSPVLLQAPGHATLSMESNVGINCCRALLLHLWKGILEGLCVTSVAILSTVRNKMMRLCGIEKYKGRGRRWNAFERFGTIVLLCMLTLSIILTLRAVTMRLDDPNAGHETDEAEGKLILKILAMNLTNEIERLSNPSSCENTSTLHCGLPLDCGLGCQLHHRAACLILSYSMGIPLIHDTTAWPFGKWEDTFQPLGSNCPTNERTIMFKWFDKEPSEAFEKFVGKEFLEYVESGIQVDPDLLRAIQATSHPNPSLWFVGQFLKYTMRLSSKLSPVVNDFLSELPRSSPLVGLHIRRTDKLKEIEGSYHEIKDYIIPADAYFRNANCSVNCTVYLASDDHTMLSQAQKLYPLPQWRFIGLNMSETLHIQKLRYNPRALMSIIKDVVALSKCDYVVCGFSSNICRLTLELMNADHPYGLQRVKSLDFPYNFKVLWGHTVPIRLVPRRQHQ